jgi:hypothetical protein
VRALQFEGKVKGKPFIKKRFGWMLCDFLQLFTQLLSGIFKAILRILMAIGLLLVASLRIDRSVFPAWVDELIVLDAMAKSYRSVVLLYHHHNNPIVHVFIRLAAEAAEERKAKALAGSRMAGEEPKSEADEVTARKRWVAANRWRKYAFMVLNPAVAAYRAVPPPPVEKKPSVLMKVLSKKSKTTDVTAKKDTMTPPEVDASKV